MEKCPFCKEEINENAAKCPKCNMVLIEKIPTEVKKNPPKKEAHKENFFREETKKILKQTGGGFIKIITRYKPLSIMAFVILLGMVYNYIFVNKYERAVSDITQTIGAHVKSIAIDKGRATDSNGRQYEKYEYDNTSLNIALFYLKEQDLESNYSKFFEYREKKEVTASFLEKYSTIYLFTLLEILDRANIKGDLNTAKKYANKIETLSQDKIFIEYIKNNNKQNSFEKYKSILNRLITNIEEDNTINRLKTEIKDCEINCSVERTNELIRQHNLLVKEYNENKNIGQNLFYATLDIINISLILPAQNKMELTTDSK